MRLSVNKEKTMPQIQKILTFNTNDKSIINITDRVEREIKECLISNGLLNLFVLHTSCSLMIQENADPNVLKDIRNFLEELAPEKNYFHNSEGSDDMPAHLKSLLTNTQLTLSIIDKKLTLGTWQGIYLLEHRVSDKLRNINFHFIGE